MSIEVVLVLGENRAQMRTVDDQDPIEDLAAYAANPAFVIAFIRVPRAR